MTQAAREIGTSLEALYKLRARPGAEGFAAAWGSGGASLPEPGSKAYAALRRR